MNAPGLAPPGPLRFLAAAAGALPFRDLPVFGRALGALVGDVLRVRRAHVEAAMERAGILAPAAAAGAMYRALGTSFAELLWLGGARSEVEPFVALDDGTRREFGALLARGRGMVLAASHTGNWDLAAVATARMLGPLTVVTKRLSLGVVDRLWQWTRRSHGVELVQGGPGTLGAVRGALARGRAVAMMIDQVPAARAHAVPCTFLGQEAWVDLAPALVALRSGAPLVVTTAERIEDGRQRLAIASVDVPPATGRGATWAIEATERATAALEAFVRRRPSEWLWMHRRWKDPAGPAPLARTEIGALSPRT